MKSAIFISLLLIAFVGKAQQFSDFKSLRYDEDYSSLQNDTMNNDWYKSLKFTPLNASSNVYLSFGGDLRYQYFYEKNGKWGDDPEDNDGYVLGRFLLHSDFHIGNHFRAFLQIQGSTADSKIEPSPVDLNPLEAHQAFLDIALVNTAKSRLLLRTGRQELSYGSQRLVSVREGPNNRQSFDALKLIAAKGNYSLESFYSHYVVARYGIFDDNSNTQRQFWGSYLQISDFPTFKHIDLYYLGYQRKVAVYDDGHGTEKRHSVGMRVWGKYKNWRYDGETVYQFGSLDSKNISAWTASINAGYKFYTVFLKPEIGLKTEVISGDRHTGDNRLETFNPLFPRGGYFGLASLIGPSNLIDIHPSVQFEISKTIDWVIDYDIFWRQSTNDGLYAPNGAMIYPKSNDDSKKIGNQLESDLIFHPNQYLYFRLEATWFAAGDYLKASGTGKDILFTGVTMQLHF
jgi:hypothetical protein